MKILAKENIRIATDGIGHSIATARAGEVFDIADGIAEILVRNGQAEVIDEKQIESAPENKMIKKAPQKKGKA